MVFSFGIRKTICAVSQLSNVVALLPSEFIHGLEVRLIPRKRARRPKELAATIAG
jgi:hypothetical protein